jgi:hypothetical protein
MASMPWNVDSRKWKGDPDRTSLPSPHRFAFPFASSRDTNRPQPPTLQRQTPGSRVAAGRSRAGKPDLHSFIHSCPFVSIRGSKHHPIPFHSWFKTTPAFVSIRGSKSPVPALAIIRENPCQSVAKNTPHPWRCCPCGDRKPIAGGSLATCWRADWPSSIRSWRSGA